MLYLQKFCGFMKKISTYIGLYLIILGAIVLALTRFHALMGYNSLLLCGLGLIVAGIVLHIYAVKRRSNY